MIKYKARCDCVITREGISVEIPKGSIWVYMGCLADYVTLHRQNVDINIPKDRIGRLFRELKEN